MILGTYIWKEIKGMITVGGDDCLCCPSCGGDIHTMGIETLYNHHNECKKCKINLIYPWEVKNESICN